MLMLRSVRVEMQIALPIARDALLTAKLVRIITVIAKGLATSSVKIAINNVISNVKTALKTMVNVLKNAVAVRKNAITIARTNNAETLLTKAIMEIVPTNKVEVIIAQNKINRS